MKESSSVMANPQSQQAQSAAVSAFGSNKMRIQPQRSSSRATVQFVKESVKDSIRKIHSPASSNIDQVGDLQKALREAQLLNADHQEDISILTVERDAAETELHINKHKSSLLEKDFTHSEQALANVQELLHRALLRNEAQQAELRDKDRQVEELRLKVAEYEQSLVTETSQRLDLEDCVEHIKVRVQDADIQYTKLESKVQAQKGTILQLKAENTLIKHERDTDAVNHTVNKHALSRTNVKLKQQVQSLRTELEAEKKKSQEELPSVDWRAYCLQIHFRRSMDLERAKAEMVEPQSQNLELWEEMKILQEEDLRQVASAGIESRAQATSCSPTVENDISRVVIVADVSPSASEAAEIASDDRKNVIPRQYRDTWASPAVFLVCLLAVWYLQR